jgi:prophage DNA circulation protein
MNWIEQLLPASFRGVPFQVDTIEHQAGDNVVLREYPFQDLPTVFRMGEGVEEIKLSAYVIGDDYMDLRDRLRQVLTGDGILVHPTAGSIRVFVVGKHTIKENPVAEGGMARFDLTFVRAETRRYPVGETSTRETAVQQAEVAQEATADAFESSFALADKPGWVADQLVARITDSVAAVWEVIGSITGEVNDFTNTVIGNYQALRDGLNTLVRQPRLLVDALKNLFALPGDLQAAAARDFAAAFEGLFDMSTKVTKKDFEVSVMPAVGAGLVIYGTGNADTLGLATPARAQLAAMTTAIDQMVESLALSAWVRAVAVVDLASYDDAVALRGKVAAQATRLLLRASTNISTTTAADSLPASSYHDAMAGLMTAALADLQVRSRDLGRMTSYTPDGWMPVWLVSYKLFGTADFADEILTMNPHITHPLLVPPGKALRIMRHD